MIHQVSDRPVDEALSFHSAQTLKRRALDDERKVAFSGAIVAGVAGVLVAVVSQRQVRRCERCLKPADHLGRDGAVGFVGHGVCIAGVAGEAHVAGGS